MPLLVNGTDLKTLGFRAARWAGDLTPAVGRPPSVAVPGRPGEAPNGAEAAVAPRTLQFTGSLQAPSAALLEARVRALIAHCQGAATRATSGPVTVAVAPVGQTPAVQWTAYLDGGATQVDRGSVPALARTAAVTLTFTALDPIAVDVAATVLALGVVLTRLPVGTAASDLQVTLAGPLAAGDTRVLTLRDGADADVGSLTITVPAGQALAADAVLEIDGAEETVTTVAADGTRTPRAAWLSAGDFFALGAALVVGGVNPGLVLNAGTGTVTYRRGWRA